MTINTSVCARYRYADGWHIFDSEDLPGLYVASRDAEQAFNNVGQVIEGLFKLDHGIDIQIVPEVSVKEFLAAVAKDKMPSAEHPLILSDRRFQVMGAVA
ncbi:hypothetical protein J7E70_02380 [Variovorax paradoxus]|nr:hypothetical protein [Variovorax paradoxus]MBT2299300.1 hypothetical protein [Variovorax paradoxus]